MPSAIEQEHQMDFQEFLIAISKFNWGLASSNTYRIKKPAWKAGDPYKYLISIQISELGDKGKFEKRTFALSQLNIGLLAWFNEFI